MKKNIIFAVLACAAIISCNKENLSQRETEPFSIDLNFEDYNPEVKSSLEGGDKDTPTNLKVAWGSSDKNVYAFDSEGVKNTLTWPNTSGDKYQRNFAGSITKGSSVKYILYSGKAANKDTARIDGNVIKGEKLDAKQKIYTHNSFSTSQNISIMKPSDSAMRNVFGYIRFFSTKGTLVATSLYLGKIASVKLTAATEGEYLNGDLNIDYSGSDPVVSVVKNGSSTTELVCYAKDTKIDNVKKYYLVGGYYYICIPPGTYHGLKIQVFYNDDFKYYDSNTITGEKNFTLKHTGDLTITRNKVWNAGNLLSIHEELTKASLTKAGLEGKAEINGWTLE